MDTSDPMTSTTSLLSTNTTSSSFDPKKEDKNKRPPPQKDFAAAFSALQSKYGLPNATTSTPLPPPSRKSVAPQYLPAPANPAGSTPRLSSQVAPLPAKQQRGEKAKPHPSPLALLRARYRSGGSPVPPSSLSASCPSEGEGSRGKEDKNITEADGTAIYHSS